MPPKLLFVGLVAILLLKPGVAADEEGPPQITDPAHVPGLTDWGGFYVPTPEVDIVEVRWSTDDTSVTFTWRVLDLSSRTQYEDLSYSLAFDNELPGFEYKTLNVGSYFHHRAGWGFAAFLGCTPAPCNSASIPVQGSVDEDNDIMTVRVPRALLDGNGFTCGRISSVGHAWDLWETFHVGAGLPTGADIAPKEGVFATCGPDLDLR